MKSLIILAAAAWVNCLFLGAIETYAWGDGQNRSGRDEASLFAVLEYQCRDGIAVVSGFPKESYPLIRVSGAIHGDYWRSSRDLEVGIDLVPTLQPDGAIVVTSKSISTKPVALGVLDTEVSHSSLCQSADDRGLAMFRIVLASDVNLEVSSAGDQCKLHSFEFDPDFSNWYYSRNVTTTIKLRHGGEIGNELLAHEDFQRLIRFPSKKSCKAFGE
ncbi:hypothetical protein WDW86_19815 [Bdellovibrionota bacterium FG-2]